MKLLPVFFTMLLVCIVISPLSAQTPGLDLFNSTADPFYRIGKDASDHYLQLYTKPSSVPYIQESFLEGGTSYLVSKRYRSHTYYAGKVGIGLDNPIAQLDVNGNIHANSWLVMFGPGGNFDNGGSSRRGVYVDNDISTSWEFLTLQNSLGTHFRVNGNGFTGIGTLPAARLHVKQKDGSWVEGIMLEQGAHQWNIVSDGDGERLLISQDRTAEKGITILNGNVGIGTASPSPDYKMVVEGKLAARKIKVTNVVNWSDFVFQPDYKLLPLAELEKFILQNRHLPEIPTEKEVKEEGIDVADINKKLLQKIEELTLYVIEQDKKMNAMKAELEGLKTGK